MATRKIVTVGGPKENVLHAKAKKVSRFDAYLDRLVKDMFDTMRAAPGVGLAAPQVGESVRVLVAEFEDNTVALVNPEVVESEGEELGTEACLSIPGYVGDNVPRATRILVKARDPKGKFIKIPAEGWWARILQHEIDHLDGILYTDRISAEFVREAAPGEVVEEPEALVEPQGGGVARIEKNLHEPTDSATPGNSADNQIAAKSAIAAVTSEATEHEKAAKSATPVTRPETHENGNAAKSAKTPDSSATGDAKQNEGAATPVQGGRA